MHPRLLAPAATLAIALLVSGCGGSADDDATAAPRATSAADFCGALTDFRADFADADPSDPAAFVTAVKAAATRLDAVGTPDDLPDEARAGFELTIGRIAALPADASSADLEAVGRADRAERAQLRALDDYVGTTCPDQ